MRKVFIFIIAIILVALIFILIRSRANGPGQKINNSISTTVAKLPSSQSLNIDDLAPSGSDVVIYVDRKTGYLKSFKPDQILYQKPVYQFSYKFPFVALIERDSRSSVFLLNIRTKEVKKYNVANEESFISISLSPTKTVIFALGSFSTADRTSQLYSINVIDKSSNKLSRTKVTQVEAIDDGNVILFNPGEHEDSSTLSLYNVERKNALYEISQINEYRLSGDFKNILTRTKSNSTSAILNISSLNRKQFDLMQNDLVAWKNSNLLLVLHNTFPGIELSYLDIEGLNSKLNFVTIEEMRKVAISKIIAVIGNQLVVADNRYNFYEIDLTKLPQP